MKKIEHGQLVSYTGGDWKCKATINFIRLVGSGSIMAGGPAGIALGITLHLTAAGLDTAGACS